jgi:predicted ester cyclase
MHHTIEDIIAKGDRVIVRTTNRATHKAEIMGIPPTGKKIVYSVIDICRFENGKIVEEWAEFDSLGMLMQLGGVKAEGGGEIDY